MVATRVKNSAGREVAAVTQEVLLAAGASQAVTLETEVTAPALWSPDEPSLYTMEVEIAESGKVLDAVEERFGIRSIAFSAEEGFLLNGEPVLLKGVAFTMITVLWDPRPSGRLNSGG